MKVKPMGTLKAKLDGREFTAIMGDDRLWHSTDRMAEYVLNRDYPTWSLGRSPVVQCREAMGIAADALNGTVEYAEADALPIEVPDRKYQPTRR